MGFLFELMRRFMIVPMAATTRMMIITFGIAAGIDVVVVVVVAAARLQGLGGWMRWRCGAHG